MALKTVPFLALLFTALTLGPSLAHLLELPNKIDIPRDDYLTVQRNYDGWALLGIVIFGALLTTLALTVMLRGKPRAFVPSLLSFLCLAAGHALFWIYTFPANRATRNWTFLPDNWEELRRAWEYSHAAAAILNLAAFVALALAVLADRREPRAL